IDTFAGNHLGFGLSKLLSSDPMTNACNGSLPQGTGTPCVPQAGVCDCQGLPANQRMDQQFSTRYLNPNPLSARCSHTSSQRLERVTNQVNEMVQIVDDTLAKLQPTGVTKVDLLGWAVGGPVVGKYLGDNTSYSGESMSTR